MTYDVIVLGGGAGGLSAARAAARRRARTLLIQDGPLGGDCTFTGCVPSKALLAAAAAGASFADAMASVHRAVATVAATEDDAVLARDGVEVLHGRGRLRAPGEVEVDGRRLRAPRIVVATGARPVVPAVPGLDASGVLTSDTVFDMDRLPARLVVIGGGSIGCELAQAFARLGAAVTVIEARPRLLPGEDQEASAAIAGAFAVDGIDVRTGATVVGAERVDGRSWRLRLAGGDAVECDAVLVAAGRVAATDGLGLDEAGVDRDAGGAIRTDAYLRTTARGVWAVGDVNGRMLFTHAADEMGRVAIANALARVSWRRFDPRAIPWVTFTSPEVGRVGLTEAEAASRGGRVAFVPMGEVDRAVAEQRTEGFVKLVAGPRRVVGSLGGGRILGATVVAARGGELVHEAALAMRTRLAPARLALTVHAYPTWSIGVQQAAAQFFVPVNGRRAQPARAAE